MKRLFQVSKITTKREKNQGGELSYYRQLKLPKNTHSKGAKFLNSNEPNDSTYYALCQVFLESGL